MRRLSLIGLVTFLALFVYFYKTSGKFRKSIVSALVSAFFLASLPLESEAKDTDAFRPQQQTQTSRVENNKGLFSRGARKPKPNGPRKPDGSDGYDNDMLPQYPKTESVQETESRLDEFMARMRMEESSDSDEEQCQATEELQVKKSYESNSALRKVAKNNHKSKLAMKNLEDVIQKLREGENPMKIGYSPCDLGNGFYYIRKSNARIVVKVDATSRNSDIVGFAIRSNQKNMKIWKNWQQS